MVWLALPGSHCPLSSFTGPYPSESARTKAVFPLSSGTSHGGWSAQLVSKQDNILTISISSPANAPIGWYTLNTQISSQGKDFVLKLGTFILLFNPWLPGRDQTNHSQWPSAKQYRWKGAGKRIFPGSSLIRGSSWAMERV